VDFTVPVEGLEAPWGMAQIVFIYDTARVSDPPRSMMALLAWAEAHPGRFTYPAPPDFTGTTFLKQALYELTPDPARLAKPVSEADFAAATAPLWAYLDKLHPLLWRHGQQFPGNSEAMRQALDDGEIDIAFNFNPGEASSAIAQGLLPGTVRSYVFDRGSIANTHFLAIPFGANSKAGAMIVANFLMSPEAQAHKQDPAVWGDPTVLDVAALDPAARKLFADLPQGVATLPPEKLGRTLPEPDPSWMTRLTDEWRQRYAR
jgi:putative thiamine transport system substrate-binding protein